MLIVAIYVWWEITSHPTEVTQGPSMSTPQGVHPLIALGVSAALAGVVGWFLMRMQDGAVDARQARRHLQALGEVLDVWQWQTDAQHRVIEARPPAGETGDDVTPISPAPLLWEHFRPADEQSLRIRMIGGSALDDIDVLRTKADGSLVRGRLRGRAVVDRTGRFAGYVGTLRDSAPVVPASPPEAYGAAAMRAGSTSLPAATGGDGGSAADHESFGYTVSHDLRAPIRVVEGFTKIIKEDYGNVLDRIGHDHLDRVLGAAARMNSMIDALLGLSKLSSLPIARQPVDLTELAGFVAEDLRREWPGRQVTFHATDGMRVIGDPTLLRVVLENLLGNAWKYTAHCGHAQIRFVRSDDEPVTFTVTDNGAGFDMRFADRLFGVFQRLHSASEFPGTGVGLASVRRIIRRHGGDIWAEAEPERGARFHFTLPQGDARR